MLLPLDEVVFRRGKVPACLGVSHRGIGPDMRGRSGRIGEAFARLGEAVTEVDNQLNQPNTRFFPVTSGLAGIGLRGHVGSSSYSAS